MDSVVKKGPCVVSIIRHQYYSEPYSCPDLKWDNSKNRYICNALVKAIDKEEKRQIKKALSIGKGCCCGLNTDRNVIINRGRP